MKTNPMTLTQLKEQARKEFKEKFSSIEKDGIRAYIKYDPLALMDFVDEIITRTYLAAIDDCEGRMPKKAVNNGILTTKTATFLGGFNYFRTAMLSHLKTLREKVTE